MPCWSGSPCTRGIPCRAGCPRPTAHAAAAVGGARRTGRPAASRPEQRICPASAYAERPSWEQDRWSDGDLGAAAPAWPDVARTDPAEASAAPPTAPSEAHPPWEDATPDGRAAGAGIDPLTYVPPAPAATLTAAFAKAAGVAAATETLNGARERQAVSYIGWPPGRLATRLRRAGRAPARKLLAGDPADMAQAQRSDIDNAITAFADEVGGSLPEPWSRTVRAAARSARPTPSRPSARSWRAACRRGTR